MDNLAYDINSIIDSVFLFNSLDKYPVLKRDILSLKIPSLEKIYIIENHLKKLDLAKEVKHHITIRLDLLKHLLS